MLIPLDYRNERVLHEIELLWRDAHPTWKWSRRNPYQAEYSWAIDRLVEITGSVSGKKIMDAGGGRGALQHVIAAMGADVLNVDIEPQPHTSKLAKPTKQLKASLEATGLSPKTFDGIVSVSAVEHNEWSVLLRVVQHLIDLLKPGAPLVLTFPAAAKRQWIPDRGWPLPHQAGWPKCYLFDEEAARELIKHISDVADLKIPTKWLGVFYTSAWAAQHKDMQTNSPPDSRYPYLSAGLVLVRKL